MKNNLSKVENCLRSIARRNKSIKYSLGLAILFLMMGISAFSEEIVAQETVVQQEVMTTEQIASSKENLKNSVGSLQSKIDSARAENEKGLAGLKLELIQLMEQGDQVVKSPWMSWQFGANYMYSKWNGTYKGRGDKSEKYPYEGIFTRSENLFERVVSPLSEKYKSLATSTDSHSASSNARNGLGSGYGLGSTEKKQEPIVTIEINAAIKPKSIQKNPISLDFTAPTAPNVPEPDINQAPAPSLNLPEPKAPSKQISIVQPNASPFTGFFFNGAASDINLKTTSNHTDLNAENAVDVDGKTLYAGINPDSVKSDPKNATPALKTGAYEGNNFSGSLITEHDERPTNILYRVGKTIKNSTFYVRGYFGDGSDGYTDAGSGHIGGSDAGTPTLGTISVHTLLDTKVENVKAYLYGRAGFLTSETWRNGKVKMTNTEVNVYGKENSVFYIMPSAWGTISEGYTDPGRRPYYIGSLQGTTNVNLHGSGNNVYLSAGISGARWIENDGNINSYGASNIVYSGMSYVPNWENTYYQKTYYNTAPKNEKMQSRIKLSKVNLLGDENVGLFFGSKMGGPNPKSWEPNHRNNEDAKNYIRKSSYIGIYQGEIDIAAKIGTSAPTSEGKLNKTGYTDTTVDGAVGVFVQSGQRTGISPTRDLGVPHNKTGYAQLPTDANNSDYQRLASLDDDEIHNLEISRIDIHFGKYSKNGFMVISKLGSVVDIGKATTHHYITNSSTSFTDGINGENTTEDEAATGTVVTYAEGVWKQSEHRLGTTEKYLKDNNDRKAGSTAAALEGKSSAINVHIPLTMTAKEGIAYMGDNQGIVNAKGKTTAVNYGAIIGYARNKGKVTIDGEVEAVDKNTTSDDNKFKNIAAFAESGGEVEINKKVTINGIGAFAKGANSTAKLLSGNDIINAGTVGGMVATEGGYARLDGGTINITKNNSRLFYADSTGRIDFTKNTTINMSKGIILPQEENNTSYYNSKTVYETGSVPTKYNGMKYVTIKLLTDDVVLKTVNNHAPETWTGSANFESGIQSIMKYHMLDKNGHTYKVYYTNGEFKLAHNVDLDTKSDVFNSIIMGNEKVTINSGISVTSNAGKGLSQGSIKDTVDNSKTAYINNGIVNIGGANSSSTGIRVNHGTIENNSLVKMNDGIGLYGTNGSKITNKANGVIDITSSSNYGVGISAFLSGKTAQDYGTDKLISNLVATSGGNLSSTIKTIDITNEGKIKIAGKGIGIYADNNVVDPLYPHYNFNNHVTKENAVVNNKASLELGDESTGILTKKATINLTGTGTNDISVGKKGIGVNAKDSRINLLTDYGFQIKDNGIGVYAENTDTSTGTMNVRYTGSATEVGTGAYFKGANTTNKLNINVENVSNATKGMIGIYSKDGNFTNEGNITIKNTNTLGFGILASNSNVTNKGNISLEDSLNPTRPNIGMYTAGTDILKNIGKITVGKNGIGIYGKDFSNGDSATHPNSIIETGENGIGVYTANGNGYLESGSINVGKDGVGVYVAGNNGTITASNPFKMNLGDGSSGNNKGSFGFVNVGTGNKIYSDISNVTLKNNSVYIYSKDTSGNFANPQVTNNTNITTTGNNNYGLYSAGYVINNGNMNFGTGTGNVGVYSIKGGTIENRNGVITVGGSVPGEDEYGLGMAAGYTWTKKDLEKPISQRPEQTTGNIINRGTINVNGEYSIGMYGSGDGTTVVNHGNINLNKNNTTGVYLTDKAVGHNYGTITNTVGVRNVTAIVVKNGARFVNESTGVVRLNAANALGVLRSADEGESLGVFENYGTFEIKGEGAENQKTPSGPKALNKTVGNVSIDVPAGATEGTIKVGGQVKVPELVDTKKLTLEETQVSSIGMYINTSGTKFTKPITGLNALSRLKRADLIIGVEATETTNSKYIRIGDNILKPYNESILNNPQIEKWNIYSGSLTWVANIAQNQSNGTIENAYLAKIPYTHWAGNQSTPVDSKDTYNFLDGLEQRYGVEGIGTKENQVFQKLNGIGKNEEILFFQAIDEMMGHQYANVQQRVQATGIILDKEFNYLRDEWRTASKDSNKIKTFGTNGEYKTDTAGVIDYKNNAYGVAYVHENEDIKLGKGIGWYTGIVHNTFKFKDIGRSKEQMLQTKVGLLKSVPFDDNNSLNWTISGDIFVGRNRMHRKFLVVDEIFNAKSKYYTYGIGVRNEIGKEFRLSEGFTLRPYAALKLEYGRVSKIREKSGEIKLEVKQNQYFSVRPEIGAELGFKHYFGMKALRTTLGVAYENELGRVANGKNKARVVDTTADWFNIRGEKEDRKGNVKVDLNVGVDNTRVGVTANVGYDTKGENLRGGLGLRVIF
ncbi:autotransporter-associated N-terminal domain-containing protein [Fusobacterium nucleatum]|nr:autotransporter-associated N-terminal domain-containing protein [Fusobacterium nucleatum]BEP06783.1 autotransporter-associated N-terminal domain-containing protein [Fusobacterium nucleatum]